MSTDRLAEAREALERITDYFDQRADADAVGDPARYQGNREMYLRRDAETVAAALSAARRSALEEFYDMVQTEDSRSLTGVSAHDPLRRLMTAIRALAEKEAGK